VDAVRATAAALQAERELKAPSTSRGNFCAKGRVMMKNAGRVWRQAAVVDGVVGIYTIGSFVHVLFAVAIGLFLVGLFSGRGVLG
jgi:hypothetical protein